MSLHRRQFCAASAGGLGIAGILSQLGGLSAQETRLKPGTSSGLSGLAGCADIEPLVRFLEQTPRESLIEDVVARIKRGLTYRELLAALLLAGVRNVQPRPSVGFKFHAVLVVNSAHLASLNAIDEDRWLPLLWAIDNFKSSQARDVREGDWTLPPVDEPRVPKPHQATSLLTQALESWDPEAADVAIAALTRHFGAHHVFATLAPLAVRDYRSIGHKVIYLSNAFRTLETIGWEYAEPVMRSLVYAMLNHQGQTNPSQSDHEADRAGRENTGRIQEISEGWKAGRPQNAATVDLIHTIRDGSSSQASAKVVELLNGGVALRSIWDGLFAAAGELLMRQRGIIAIHAITTSNALHHAFRQAADDRTRKFLLLQNASFLPMFRDSARSRGSLADRWIDELEPLQSAVSAEQAVPDLFQTLGQDRQQASRQLYGFLQAGNDPQPVLDHARRLVFLKGDDAHDYKFSSAALEDYRTLTPAWRDRFLAAAIYQLRSANEPTRPLVHRVQAALG